MVVSNQWTYELTNSVMTIDTTFNFTVLSILVTTGTATVQGVLFAGGLPSAPFTLALGQGVTITSGDSSSHLIDNITIDATAGTVALIGK